MMSTAWREGDDGSRSFETDRSSGITFIPYASASKIVIGVSVDLGISA